MKINASYPYPVLYTNNDDYVDSSFSSNIQVQESFGDVVIEVNFQLDNKNIKQLIDSGDCVYSVHIECGQTSYRSVFNTKNEVKTISIPADQLRGKIFIHSFILANKPIDNYANPKLNEWYQDIPISFDIGSIIAIGSAIETTLYEDNEEMLNLPSIISVTSLSKGEYMEVDLTQDLIVVSLPKYEYEQYIHHRKSLLKDTILASVFMPVLVQVFSSINQEYDFEDSTWYQVLEKIFAENNIRIEDVGTDSFPALQAAQMVLRKPMKTSFEEIENFNKGEE